MRREAVESTDAFRVGGRGPELESWLHDTDLLFPGHHVGFSDPPGRIVGAQVDGGWVILHGLQVVQVVPEEVHSYWHRRLPSNGPEESNVWRVAESDWLKGFNPRHLESCQHFVLEFYDELVEAVAEAVIFGTGVFDLESAIAGDGRLGYAYLRRALSFEREGRSPEAESSFLAYLATEPSQSSREYAQRCFQALRGRA